MATNADTSAPAPALDATVRIEHDRKRLLLRLLAGVAGVAAITVGLVITLLHPGQIAVHPAGVGEADALLPRYVTALPRWAPLILVLSLASACIGLLRSIVRLQDGDPALVLSPRGVRFRATLFGDVAQIPWTAIRGLKLRQYKQQRHIEFRVEGSDRYVARVGLRGRLRRLVRGGACGVVTFSSPMSRAAWKNTGELLERYLALYGRATTVAGGREPGGAGTRRPGVPLSPNR